MTLAPPTPEHLARLGLRFEAFAMHSELQVGDRLLRFPHVETGTAIAPADWLAAKHAGGAVHEPGLVAWLFALGKARGERPVRFFDIGAAYGYFAALAHCALGDVEIVAVEPDRALADYIATMLRGNGAADVRVVKALLSDRTGTEYLAKRNFHYIQGDVRSGAGYTREAVETCALTDLLGERDRRLEILKIDTEGWQARFLPVASDALIARGAIILVECDSPGKLGPFGSSNRQVVDPFVRAGYRLWWCDHRDPAFTCEPVSTADPRLTRNSLAVLLPPGLETA